MLVDTKYLQECITLELKIGDDVCNFIIIYRSPSQTHDDFVKHFALNLDEINKKSTNCRSWWL